MATLIVHNEDIVNNTGITLSNPTGNAGTYELKNVPLTWYIEGVPFTGTIVTVGSSGCDYTHAYTALTDATTTIEGDVLVLINPGTYTWNDGEQISCLNKKLYIRGLGDSPTDTVFFKSTPNGQLLAFATNSEVIFENCTSNNVYSWRHCITVSHNAIINVNKCHLYAQDASYPISGAYVTFSGHLYVKNTKLTRGYAHLTGTGGSVPLVISNIYLDKVELNNALVANYTTGTLALNDTRSTPTSGYGYNYGEYLITEAPTIEQHNISWGGGTPVEVTDDGIYTLSDSSNTIDATVDFSELSSSKQIDLVEVEEKQENFSINFFSPTNGYAGDLITIYGTGFYLEPIVKIGNVECTISSFTDTQIEFYIPFGAETNFISVFVGSTFAITEVPLTINIPIITLNDNLICENLIITKNFNSQSHKINSRGVLFKPLSVASNVDISNSDISCYIFQIDDTTDKLTGNLLANIIIEEQE